MFPINLLSNQFYTEDTMKHLNIILLSLLITSVSAQEPTNTDVDIVREMHGSENIAAQEPTNTDVDTDNDGLVEINTLEDLNAIRYQLDGSGYRASATAKKITSGCAVGGCKGYELTRDLDFNDATIRNSHVIANKIIGDSSVGGLIGFNEKGDITNNYATVKQMAECKLVGNTVIDATNKMIGNCNHSTLFK